MGQVTVDAMKEAFGTKPESVNPYAASTFFAVDRYASYKTDWQEYHQKGGLMLCDRYTTSNAVHQAAKLPQKENGPFLDWLFDFEYNKLGLPAPTLVFFLDMPANLTFQLLQKRQGNEGDIHEKDHDYLSRCREVALEICRRYGWQIISCAPEGTPLTVEQIHEKIWEQVCHRLGQAGQ